MNLGPSIAAGPSLAGAATEPKKYSKKKPSDYILPTKDNFTKILSVNNYTIKQLKEIATHYKIKLGSVGLKAEIISRLTDYFKHYDNATRLQKCWRRVLLKQYNALRGPARFNRKLCVNETDFFTMDALNEIPYIQFYSFKDADNMIYGFDIMSLYTLFDKTYDRTYDKVSNPYNRQVFSPSVHKNLLNIVRLSKLYNDKIIISMLEPKNDLLPPPPPEPISIENRTIALFHDMDILGNYTNYTCFYNLQPPQLVRYIIELRDIWTYRANLSDEVRREICPNYRDLFRILQDHDLYSTLILHDIALTIMERLVRSGINPDSRCLGANYVLCALTLVSQEAALALPWLFQSVI